MKDRETILETVRTIMLEMFEIEPEQVTLEARLYEDLDFDSIDAVDMIVKLKEITQKTIKPDDFKNARTVDDVVTALDQLMRQE